MFSKPIDSVHQFDEFQNWKSISEPIQFHSFKIGNIFYSSKKNQVILGLVYFGNPLILSESLSPLRKGRHV